MSEEEQNKRPAADEVPRGEVPANGPVMALPKGHVQVELSADSMEAYLSGHLPEGGDPRAVQHLVAGLLREKEIRHGMLMPALKEAIAKLGRGEQLSHHLLARGTPPGPSQDATIAVQVDLGQDRKGRLTDDGHLDFRDKGPLPLVEEGTTVAVLTPAITGEPGKDILGRALRPTPPIKLRLRAGKGVRLEDDGKRMVASCRGIVTRPEADRFEVLEILDVAGDVNFKTGHVDFPGLVRVAGTVLTDFKVKAKALEVKELDPGSTVEVEGELTVEGGIMGATVTAGSTVKARFMRDSQLDCQGDVLVDSEIVQCRIATQGRVVVTSPSGRIVNSHVAAVKGIVVGVIKSSGTDSTVLRLGIKPEYEQAIYSLRKQIKLGQAERTILLEALKAQTEELKATEDELAEILRALKDPARQGNRENLLGQLEMIKPLRQGLKVGVSSGKARVEEIEVDAQRLATQLSQMEALLPEGAVWLDVRMEAEATTQIVGPRASLTLERPTRSFSATERLVRDPEGQPKPQIKLEKLRTNLKL